MIVVDPRVTKTAMMADLHLAIRPRTDITLLNGMIKILIDEGLVDRDYVAAHTEGFAELAAHVASYDLERVAAECGVEPSSSARRRWPSGAPAGHRGLDHGRQPLGPGHRDRHPPQHAVPDHRQRRQGGGVALLHHRPVQRHGHPGGGLDRLAAGLPGLGLDADRAEMAALWGLPVDRLPTARGRAYPDIIDGVLDGTIKALWIIATNPPVSFPNRGRLERALANLDLLVVQDGFDTPTTALADVVLPAAIWGEKDGTYTNSERRVSRVRKAVEPPGLARSDFDIFLAVAEALGVRDALYPGWKGPEDAFGEWGRVSAGRLCDYSGITWDRIDAAGGVQWPCPPDDAAVGGSAPPVRRRRVPHARRPGQAVVRLARAHRRRPQRAVSLPAQHRPDGRALAHPHQDRPGRHPREAGARGLGRGQPGRRRAAGRGAPATGSAWCRRRGMVDGVAVRVTATVREGEVFVPFHYDEWCVNRLTVDEFDPISREPNYKQSAVHVERMLS